MNYDIYEFAALVSEFPIHPINTQTNIVQLIFIKPFLFARTFKCVDLYWCATSAIDFIDTMAINQWTFSGSNGIFPMNWFYFPISIRRLNFFFSRLIYDIYNATNDIPTKLKKKNAVELTLTWSCSPAYSMLWNMVQV